MRFSTKTLKATSLYALVKQLNNPEMALEGAIVAIERLPGARYQDTLYEVLIDNDIDNGGGDLEAWEQWKAAMKDYKERTRLCDALDPVAEARARMAEETAFQTAQHEAWAHQRDPQSSAFIAGQSASERLRGEAVD